MALFFAFITHMTLGNAAIQYLKRLQEKGQPIRHYGPETHLKKAGTPTMGGVLLLFCVFTSAILFSDISNNLIWISLLSMGLFGGIGLYDDLQKIKLHSAEGIRARTKFALQWIVGIVITLLFAKNYTIYLPIIHTFIPLGIAFLLWSAFVIVASSNALNLTDGLDGLAIFPVITTSLALGIMIYTGNYTLEQELLVLLSAWIGASLGFLWFNAPPAKIFMGDVGSLACGASLATTALMIQQEILFAMLIGVCVIETVSVIIQVFVFKRTGKRVFLMTPIHHHFEKKGWAETTVVVRFWIASVVLAFMTLAAYFFL
ncbi:MAG: phospho-N-acetylmuramoyl-pentapeptide-transferase [Alphaproteobacteria bacterium]|nr:MAG: phospho-N-acetylmuramoyl-pentapeptide-transferase [Alphaproteobacteria bacterium]